MPRFRIALVGALAAVSIGVAAPVALADGHHGSENHKQLRTLTVVESPVTFTVTRAGVGSLTFSVDPTTLAITKVTAAPLLDSGFVAGTPIVLGRAVAVSFTNAAGMQRFVVAKIQLENGSVVINSRDDQADFDAMREHHLPLPVPVSSTTTTTTVAVSANKLNQSSGVVRSGSDNSGSDHSGSGKDGSGNGGHSGGRD